MVGGSMISLSLQALRISIAHFGLVFQFCSDVTSKALPDFTTPCVSSLRTAVLAVLKLHPQSVVILAPVCSGFSFMCSSAAVRYWYNPEGDESLSWVKAGNVMSNRVTLLCWLIAALGHVFIVEQPGSAKFGDMPRWQHFCTEVCYVLGLAFVCLLVHALVPNSSEVSFFC